MEQNRQLQDGEMLDCGHVYARPFSDGASGYAITQDGQMICYACADDRQRADLLTEDRAVAYLTRKPETADAYELTTWTGGHLARITQLTHGRHNIGGRLYRFRAVDVHGQHWYGTSPGPSMYARMRKAKRKA